MNTDTTQPDDWREHDRELRRLMEKVAEKMRDPSEDAAAILEDLADHLAELGYDVNPPEELAGPVDDWPEGPDGRRYPPTQAHA